MVSGVSGSVFFSYARGDQGEGAGLGGRQGQEKPKGHASPQGELSRRGGQRLNERPLTGERVLKRPRAGHLPTMFAGWMGHGSPGLRIAATGHTQQGGAKRVILRYLCPLIRGEDEGVGTGATPARPTKMLKLLLWGAAGRSGEERANANLSLQPTDIGQQVAEGGGGARETAVEATRRDQVRRVLVILFYYLFNR